MLKITRSFDEQASQKNVCHKLVYIKTNSNSKDSSFRISISSVKLANTLKKSKKFLKFKKLSKSNNLSKIGAKKAELSFFIFNTKMTFNRL